MWKSVGGGDAGWWCMCELHVSATHEVCVCRCACVCVQWEEGKKKALIPCISNADRAHENTTISDPPGGLRRFVCTCLLHWAPMQLTLGYTLAPVHTHFSTFPPSPPQAINGAHTAYLIMLHVTLVWRIHSVHRGRLHFPQDAFVHCGYATRSWC